MQSLTPVWTTILIFREFVAWGNIGYFEIETPERTVLNRVGVESAQGLAKH